MSNETSIRYFGPKWNDDLRREAVEYVPTPQDAICDYCHEPVVHGETGIIAKTVDMVGDNSCLSIVPSNKVPPQAEWKDVVTHFSCFIRQVIGSVAHQQQRCSCYVEGSTEEDPPGLSKREAAIAAYEQMQSMLGRH